MKKIYSNLLTKKNSLILLCIIVFLWLCYNLYNFKEGYQLGEKLTQCPSLGPIPQELIDKGIKCPDNNFTPIPGPPTQEGCYRFLPKGCTKRGGGSKFSWARDTNGEKVRCAGLDKNQCLNTRLKDFNNWCGISDTKMHWNAPTSMKKIPPTPTEPGCYRFLPKGCTKRGGGGCNQWIRDKRGDLDKKYCLDRRVKDYNNYCGISDAKMVWNKPLTIVKAACLMCSAQPNQTPGKPGTWYKGCEGYGPNGETARPWDVCIDTEGTHLGNGWGNIGDAKYSLMVHKNFGITSDKMCKDIDPKFAGRYEKVRSCPKNQQIILNKPIK